MPTQDIAELIISCKTKNIEEVERVTKEVDKADKAANKLLKTLGNLVTAAAVFKVFKGGVQTFIAAEEATSALDAAFRRLGKTNAAYRRELTELNAALAKSTIYTTAELAASQALALNMGISSDNIKKVTEAAIGLSAAYGKSLGGAMRMLALAANGNYIMLKRLGIQVDSSLSPAENFAKILDQLAGTMEEAQAKTKTTGGAITQMNKSLAGAKAALGEQLAPYVKDAAGLIGGLADKFANAEPETKRFVTVMGTVTMGLLALKTAIGLKTIAENLSGATGVAASKAKLKATKEEIAMEKALQKEKLATIAMEQAKEKVAAAKSAVAIAESKRHDAMKKGPGVFGRVNPDAVQTADNGVTAAKEQLAAAEKELQKLTAAHVKAANGVELLKAANEKSIPVLDNRLELEKKVAEADKASEKATNALVAADERLAAARKRVAELKRGLDEASTNWRKNPEDKGAYGEVNAKRQSLESAQKKYAAARSEVARLKKEFDKANAAADAANAELKALGQTAETVSAEMQKLQTVNTKASVAIEKRAMLERNLAEAKRQSTKAANALATAEAKAAIARNRLSKSWSNAKKSFTDLDEMRTSLKKIQKEVADTLDRMGQNIINKTSNTAGNMGNGLEKMVFGNSANRVQPEPTVPVMPNSMKSNIFSRGENYIDAKLNAAAASLKMKKAESAVRSAEKALFEFDAATKKADVGLKTLGTTSTTTNAELKALRATVVATKPGLESMGFSAAASGKQMTFMRRQFTTFPTFARGARALGGAMRGVGVAFRGAAAAAKSFAASFAPMLIFSAAIAGIDYLMNRAAVAADKQNAKYAEMYDLSIKSAEGKKQEREEINKHVETLELLSKYSNLTTEEQKQALESINALSQKYPEMADGIQLVNGKLVVQTDLFKKLTAAQKEQYVKSEERNRKAALGKANSLVEGFGKKFGLNAVEREITDKNKIIAQWRNLAVSADWASNKLGFNTNFYEGTMDKKEILDMVAKGGRAQWYEGIASEARKKGLTEMAEEAEKIAKALREADTHAKNVADANKAGKIPDEKRKDESKNKLEDSKKDLADFAKARESLESRKWSIEYDLANPEGKTDMLQKKIDDLAKRRDDALERAPNDRKKQTEAIQLSEKMIDLEKQKAAIMQEADNKRAEDMKKAAKEEEEFLQWAMKATSSLKDTTQSAIDANSIDAVRMQSRSLDDGGGGLLSAAQNAANAAKAATDAAAKSVRIQQQMKSVIDNIYTKLATIGTSSVG